MKKKGTKIEFFVVSQVICRENSGHQSPTFYLLKMSILTFSFVFKETAENLNFFVKYKNT